MWKTIKFNYRLQNCESTYRRPFKSIFGTKIISNIFSARACCSQKIYCMLCNNLFGYHKKNNKCLVLITHTHTHTIRPTLWILFIDLELFHISFLLNHSFEYILSRMISIRSAYISVVVKSIDTHTHTHT